MKNIKSNRAITLVALVITIIVLLILSGIAIVQLTENGLFSKVQQAKENSVQAQENENTTLKEYEDRISEHLHDDAYKYGTNIQDSYSNIYTSTYPTQDIPSTVAYEDSKTVGNFKKIFSFFNLSSEETGKKMIINSNVQNGGVSYSGAYWGIGSNSYRVIEDTENCWVIFLFNITRVGGCVTKISNFKLVYDDNEELSIEESSKLNKISPLVLYQSGWAPSNASYGYSKGEPEKMIKGLEGQLPYKGKTIFMFKINKGVYLRSIKFDADGDSRGLIAGVELYKLKQEYELSINPL